MTQQSLPANLESALRSLTNAHQAAGRPYSPCPFWFWNDHLAIPTLLNQMADFRAHGVYAFVIHPRIGLPKDQGWMSPSLLSCYRAVLTEAKRTGMWVMLYDEGMYPSGSASGQVVSADPSHQCRCLVAVDLRAPHNSIGTLALDLVRQGIHLSILNQSPLPNGVTLETIIDSEESHLAILSVPIPSVIRGLHYLDESSASEDTPLAADILNPQAVNSFIHHSYARFYSEFSEFFGDTIKAIFTDEPNVLGRPTADLKKLGAIPGTTGIIPHASRLLRTDATAVLANLFSQDPDIRKTALAQWWSAIRARLEETFYTPLSNWCQAHNTLLTGHPDRPDEIGALKHFHITGQDIVWRELLPDDPQSLYTPTATCAKGAASAAAHLGRKRNLNEFAGAYGHELTEREFTWLAKWLLIRGCNLLVPHAFYYSLRGPRKDERPPDVGPNSPWWPRFLSYAQAWSRLAYLNTEGTPSTQVAILSPSDSLPIHSAAALLRNRIDFHYLDESLLSSGVLTADSEFHYGPHHYRAIIIDTAHTYGHFTNSVAETLPPDLAHYWHPSNGEDSLVAALSKRITTQTFIESPSKDLRIRTLRTPDRASWTILFNEGSDPAPYTLLQPAVNFDPESAQYQLLAANTAQILAAHQITIFLHTLP